jgi:signal transduction histidine kinase
MMAFHRIKDPERLHALIDAILLIEADANLTTLLKSIVESATSLVGARYGALGVLASDGTSLASFITHGIDDRQRAQIGELPRGGGVLGETIRLAHPLRVEDLATHPGRSGFPANHPPMKQFLGVPVIVEDGTVFGNLYLTDHLSGEPFSAEDEDLVAGFGRAAGLVIDQAKLRSHVRDLSIAEERERLARDLHDTVIQRLFGVGLSLQLALSGFLEDSVRERINTSLDELNETIHDIRTTIFEIDQERSDADSLEDRIESLTIEVASRLGVQVQLKMLAGIDDLVAARCAQHVVQALREILSNIVRHSQAGRVDVDLSIDENMLVLMVKDDGVGFASAASGGRGLHNLASRARDLGGDCYVDSEIGHGTQVRWTANRLD